MVFVQIIPRLKVDGPDMVKPVKRVWRTRTLVNREGGAGSKGYLGGLTWKQGGVGGGAGQSLRRGGFTGRRLDVGGSIVSRTSKAIAW